MTLWNADPERFRFARDTSFGRRHMQLWSKSPVLLWIVSTECGFFLRNLPLWNNKVGCEDNITETLHSLYWTQDTVDHGFTIGMSDVISNLIHCSLYFSGHRSSFFIWNSFFLLLPLYQVCFFRQFLGSVNKVDYMTLRHGFITVSYQAYILEVFNSTQSLLWQGILVIGVPMLWYFLSGTFGPWKRNKIWLPKVHQQITWWGF